MSKRIPPLTEQQVAQAVAGVKQCRFYDGLGLYLDVMPTGSKIWRMKFRNASGSDTLLTFGHYPEVSLALARCRRSVARQMMSDGLDPRTEFNAVNMGPPKHVSRRRALPVAIDGKTLLRNAEHIGRLAVMLMRELAFPAYYRVASDEGVAGQMLATLEKIEYERSGELIDLLYGICADIVVKTLSLGVGEAELIEAMREARLAERRVG